MTLTSDGLQIALPNGDGYAYSVNYYSQRKAEADAMIPVTLLCAGNGEPGTWGTVVGQIDPAKLDGQHTFTYEGACSDAMVFTLDFQGLVSRYPNVFVRIDEMKCDGNAIKFNANNFFYGDIENNGNYRIELFNVWGKGAAEGKVLNSAFSDSQNVSSEPTFSFGGSLEITCTIITDADVAKAYTPKLVSINPTWGGDWNNNQGAMFNVKYENFQYSVENPIFDIKYESTDHAAGAIMTFVQVDDIFQYFPKMHAELDNLYLDGTKVTGYDATKVIDTNDGNSYRLELWNCYGKTKDTGCAFGTPEGDVIKELGFRNIMEVEFTIHSLFAVPQW